MLHANFPGQEFPPSTFVSFPTGAGERLGQVNKLNKWTARVVDDRDNTVWKVPYRLLKLRKRLVDPEITLKEVANFARRQMDHFELEAWRFGFDLAQSRGGICRHHKKEITLSVSYCQFASREEVLDTVLHEIAHAIAGPKHGHDHVWRKIAREIGCKAERCHSVSHSLPRWIGTCPCGNQWNRLRLNRKIEAYTGCPECRNPITWRLNR